MPGLRHSIKISATQSGGVLTDLSLFTLTAEVGGQKDETRR
jgi:hypothetical protein